MPTRRRPIPVVKLLTVICLLGAVTTCVSASAEASHHVTATVVIALLVLIGGLEAIELALAVTLPLIERIEHKMRRIRNGFDAIGAAVRRILHVMTKESHGFEGGQKLMKPRGRGGPSRLLRLRRLVVGASLRGHRAGLRR